MGNPRGCAEFGAGLGFHGILHTPMIPYFSRALGESIPVNNAAILELLWDFKSSNNSFFFQEFGVSIPCQNPYLQRPTLDLKWNFKPSNNSPIFPGFGGSIPCQQTPPSLNFYGIFHLPLIPSSSRFSHFWDTNPSLFFQGLPGHTQEHPRVLRASPGACHLQHPSPQIAPPNLMGPRFRPTAAAGSAPETFGVPELQQTGPQLQIVTWRTKGDKRGQKGTI